MFRDYGVSRAISLASGTCVLWPLGYLHDWGDLSEGAEVVHLANLPVRVLDRVETDRGRPDSLRAIQATGNWSVESW
jgi:hypothetical protein